MCEPKKFEGDSCVDDFECLANNCDLGQCKSLMSEMDSVILSQAQQFELISYLGMTDKILRPCYRATRDGWRGYDFHNHCNFISNTLSIVKDTQGWIFGGFVETWWDNRGTYASSQNAFLFSYHNSYGTMFRMNMQHGDGNHALYTADSYGKYI